MSWDLELNERGDLSGSIVTGDSEVLQRVRTRLNRELGEWFLATQSGIPWYGTNGNGLLGSSLANQEYIDLTIRKHILATEGVARIMSLASSLVLGSRTYRLQLKLALDTGNTAEINEAIGTEAIEGAQNA